MQAMKYIVQKYFVDNMPRYFSTLPLHKRQTAAFMIIVATPTKPLGMVLVRFRMGYDKNSFIFLFCLWYSEVEEFVFHT